MLSRSAIRKFRARKLDSFEFMKKLSRRQLLDMIDQLDPTPVFISHDPMWDHQLVGFLIGVYTPQMLIFFDMGLGKSRVVLELIAYLKLCGHQPRALVVVPNDVAVENWIMEVENHRPDLKGVPLYGSTKERLELVLASAGADICFIPYTGLNWMCCSLQKVGNRKNRKLTIDKRLLQLVSEHFDFMCLDECTGIMNHKSLTYRVCRRISDQYEYRLGMAGIPVGRDPQALWSQFEYCDHGETLGETLGIYREAFFKKKVNYWSGFYDYTFDKRWEELLHLTMQNRSIHYSEDECRDLPARIHKPVYVPFTEDMRAYYNQLIQRLSENKDDLRMVRNSFLHMRQLASGFIGLIDDESGSRVQIEFPDNPKIDALIQCIKEIPEKRKFLIFYEYNWTGDRLSKELNKLEIDHGSIRGGQKKENPKTLRAFVEAKSMRCLVVNNNCGAFALNLQAANYLIFIESPVSPIVRRQAEKRIHRGGQTRRCFILDLIMKDNTADETIQEYLREGQNVQAALMKGTIKLKMRKV